MGMLDAAAAARHRISEEASRGRSQQQQASTHVPQQMAATTEAPQDTTEDQISDEEVIGGYPVQAQEPQRKHAAFA